MKSPVLYESGAYFVMRDRQGFEVLKNHPSGWAEVVAKIGISGDDGLKRAITETDRRAGAPAND